MRLTFEIRLVQADDALHALESTLRARSETAALNEAIRARRAIQAAYRAWDRLDESHRNEATMTALRRRGHQMLSGFLQTDKLTVHAANGDVEEQASAMALAAMLWKVANVLDQIEDADAA